MSGIRVDEVNIMVKRPDSKLACIIWVTALKGAKAIFSSVVK